MVSASRRAGVAVVLGLVSLLASGAAWAAQVILPRPGQVGIEVQGGYGTLLDSGELGGLFGSGPNIAARLRYRMRYERALGLSFENQRFDIRVPEADWPAGSGLPGRDHINLVLSGLEFSKLFATRTPSVKMIMVGAGLTQSSGKTVNGEGFFPGDGTFLSAGFGVERFFYKSWALDFSTRYMFVFLPDDHLHDVQVSLGLMFYASY
jgi:hypothetical protein